MEEKELASNDSMAAEIFAFLRQEYSETHRPIPLTRIKDEFGSHSSFALYEGITELYDSGKIHEPKIGFYIPWD